MTITVQPTATATLSGTTIFEGIVGVRPRGDDIEIGYFGTRPREKMPCLAALDGRAVNILRVLPDVDRNAASPRFFTLIAQYVDDPT